jgi:hypothetical protein
MTELDEIVLVTKMAYALRECKDLFEGDRKWYYLSRVGVDLNDLIPGMRERLDRRAIASERFRRQALLQSRIPTTTVYGISASVINDSLAAALSDSTTCQ